MRLTVKILPHMPREKAEEIDGRLAACSGAAGGRNTLKEGGRGPAVEKEEMVL